MASADPYGYRLRGDRCEGVYAREVALATLLVASFTTSFESFEPSAGAVELAWWPPGPGSVHLRAHSLRRRLYYRMDARTDAAARRWTWPTDLLSAIQLPMAELGVVAWVDGSAVGVQSPVYLPLRVGRHDAPDGPRLVLVLLPGRELREVFLHLSPLGAPGSPGPPILEGQPLGYGYYPADRGIRIQLPTLPGTGLYRLEIAVDIVGGGAVTRTLIFHHERVDG